MFTVHVELYIGSITLPDTIGIAVLISVNIHLLNSFWIIILYTESGRVEFIFLLCIRDVFQISLFDVLHHLIKTISLKISSGFRYIIIFLCNHDIFLFFYEIMKQNHLRFYRISFSVLFTLIGKPCIKGCM